MTLKTGLTVDEMHFDRFPELFVDAEKAAKDAKLFAHQIISMFLSENWKKSLHS